MDKDKLEKLVAKTLFPNKKPKFPKDFWTPIDDNGNPCPEEIDNLFNIKLYEIGECKPNI
jgi:hypothetical protein